MWVLCRCLNVYVDCLLLLYCDWGESECIKLAQGFSVTLYYKLVAKSLTLWKAQWLKWIILFSKIWIFEIRKDFNFGWKSEIILFRASGLGNITSNFAFMWWKINNFIRNLENFIVFYDRVFYIYVRFNVRNYRLYTPQWFSKQLFPFHLK